MKPSGLTVHGVAESDMTEHTHTRKSVIYIYIYIYIKCVYYTLSEYFTHTPGVSGKYEI